MNARMNKKNVKRENQNSYHPYGAISNIEASKKTRIEDGLNNNAGTSNSAGKSPIIELNDPNSNRAGTTSLGGQQQYKILNDNNSEGVADEEIHIKNATMWSVSPKELSVFCRKLVKLNDDKTINYSDKKGNVSLETLVKETDLKDTDMKAIQAAFRGWYRTASNIGNIPFPVMLKMVTDCIEDGKSVTFHPKFPKLPMTAYAYFCLRLGVNKFDKIPENIQQIYHDKDSEDVKESEAEYARDRDNYCQQLRDFIDEHMEELPPAQIVFADKKLKSIEKQAKAEQRKKVLNKDEKKPVISRKKKLTAFEYFKLTKKDEYLDLEEEKRDRKLHKKFNNLSQEQRDVFESIAANL